MCRTRASLLRGIPPLPKEEEEDVDNNDLHFPPSLDGVGVVCVVVKKGGGGGDLFNLCPSLYSPLPTRLFQPAPYIRDSFVENKRGGTGPTSATLALCVCMREDRSNGCPRDRRVGPEQKCTAQKVSQDQRLQQPGSIGKSQREQRGS